MSKFAFLVHPRDSARGDMSKVFWPSGLIPDPILERIIKQLPPIASGRVTYTANKEIAGWIIVIPLTGPQIYSLPRSFVFGRIIQAVKKAKKLGATVVGLGALISSITHGGKDLVHKVSGVRITNGNSLTAGLTVEAVEKAAIEIRGIQLQDTKVAVLGATGSIGQAISFLLAERNVPLILTARGRARLRKLRERIISSFPHAEVNVSNGLIDVREAGVVIVVTSAVTQTVESEHLQRGALVYDDTQPRNTSPNILKIRNDVTIIDGGLVSTPATSLNMDIGLGKGVKLAYACLAETMLLAINGAGENGNYVGDTHPDGARKMLAQMKKYPSLFQIAPFQSFGSLVDS